MRLTGRICIDPGHPSEVGEGTRGKALTEIQAAWRVAKALEKRLVAAGHTVRLTKRREGEKVLNRRRARIANEFRADLLLRLHCDSEGGTGFAVYFPDRPGTDPTGKRGPSAQVLERSSRAAAPVHAALVQGLAGKLRDNGLHPDTKTHIGGKQGALTGSIWSEIPVVLVEMCVLTNPSDEAFLRSEAGVAIVADALAAGTAEALAALR